jgi:hypothetical protein
VAPRFFDLSRFSNTHTLIFELVTFLMSKFCRSTDWNTRSNFTFCIKFKTQSIASYKFWDKFKFESSLNFKGIRTFLKKSDKFYKISYPHPILDYQFTLTHLYSNIESLFTSGNRYLVYFIPNMACHLRLLPPLSQLYH